MNTLTCISLQAKVYFHNPSLELGNYLLFVLIFIGKAPEGLKSRRGHPISKSGPPISNLR